MKNRVLYEKPYSSNPTTSAWYERANEAARAAASEGIEDWCKEAEAAAVACEQVGLDRAAHDLREGIESAREWADEYLDFDEPPRPEQAEKLHALALQRAAELEGGSAVGRRHAEDLILTVMRQEEIDAPLTRNGWKRVYRAIAAFKPSTPLPAAEPTAPVQA